MKWNARGGTRIAVAVAAGVAVGGFAGSTIRGSGMLYTNLFVAGSLLVLLALAGLGGLAAALTQHTSAARTLAGFAGVAVITTGVAYSLASPYRSANADLLHRGSATVQVAEPAAIEWDGAAECRTGPHDPAVFMLWMPHVKVGDQWIAVLLNLDPEASPVQAEKLTIATSSPTVASAHYIASSGNGLEATLVGTNGLTGSLQFTADLVPNPARQHDPDLDRLTGTFAWTCEPTPSG